MSEHKHPTKLRQMIAVEVAKMLANDRDLNISIIKKKVARRFGVDYRREPSLLPSNQEIRQELLRIEDFYEDYQMSRLSVDKEPEQQPWDLEATYQVFEQLLLPLEYIDGGKQHPEGDLLYHSLQVFDLAKNEYSYDIEFLQTALLHDIGQAIDPLHHAEAGAYELESITSPRVVFLVKYHMDALALQQKTLGHKKKVFLKNSPYFEDLMSLRNFDNKGREKGVDVSSLEEALAYIKNLEVELL